MSNLHTATVVLIDEETKVAAARRAAREAAERYHLDQDAIARAELISVELANNILRHAGSGQMFFGPSADLGSLQIVAADKGPGIVNLARAFEDGYSTAGTPGKGLGGIQRLAQHFDVATGIGRGLVAAALVSSNATDPIEPNTAVLATAIKGETENGDACAIHHGAQRRVFCVADGLGHGHYAAEASVLATSIFIETLDRDPERPLGDLLQQMHGALHATRGAAVALFAVEHTCQTATGCGVGNISCLVQMPDGSTRSLASHNGTVGHQMRRVQEFPFAITPGAVLVMHSDGLSTHWKLTQYAGLARHSPAVLAGLLYRDAVRGRDDATVLIARLVPRVAEVHSHA